MCEDKKESHEELFQRMRRGAKAVSDFQQVGQGLRDIPDGLDPAYGRPTERQIAHLEAAKVEQRLMKMIDEMRMQMTERLLELEAAVKFQGAVDQLQDTVADTLRREQQAEDHDKATEIFLGRWVFVAIMTRKLLSGEPVFTTLSDASSKALHVRINHMLADRNGWKLVRILFVRGEPAKLNPLYVAEDGTINRTQLDLLTESIG